MKPIIIFSAVKAEVKGIIRQFKFVRYALIPNLKIYQAEFQNINLFLVITGIGLKKSRLAAEKALNSLNPQFIINLGTAGTLNPDLKISSILIPQYLLNIENEFLDLDTGYLKTMEIFCQEKNLKLIPGSLISLPKGIINPFKRNKIRREFMAQAVDMEAHPQLLLAQKLSIPFVCIKVISDKADLLAPFSYFWHIKRNAQILTEITRYLISSI